jgi:hypothetical protein
VLAVIHFLQTTSPPVLPVLQQLYGATAASDYAPSTIVRTHDGREYECAYCTDMDAVGEALAMQRPLNTASLGELLIGFFRRYAHPASRSNPPHRRRTVNSLPTTTQASSQASLFVVVVCSFCCCACLLCMYMLHVVMSRERWGMPHE